MSRPIPIAKTPIKPAQPGRAKAGSGRKPSKPRRKTKQLRKQNWWLVVLEGLALAIAAVLATMFVLGYSASWLSGPGFFTSLLPFAVGVVILMLAAAALLIAWSRLRVWLHGRLDYLPSALAVSLAASTGWFVMHDGYIEVFTHFRTLVGGKQEAERVTLAHQVYAAYRRHGIGGLQKMMERADAFNPAIEDAAKAFDVDVNLLQGIAATESSFMPRDSFDGGKGLFQITAVPKAITREAADELDVAELQVNDPRHNAFVAAATFKHYLQQMNGDLFLGLLAYNIGPRNGGLRFIMQQYGAKDFVTMQPYLQTLPRDYPIRVLSYALAFKLYQREGKLPAYEEGDNAVKIQLVGIPGF
ncbi:transglycosylase SLT domain-containing protein [Methylomonas montana]|uniref:transglycosylase SLT domain-containing protein n=1 Tax=Methylomonas montana TaxID=3058963 RepID=UPI0026591F77|nr:transglycosylase SLT domain-containing protein [Methylomonas montana]WKJ91032.1 transglycosylase SLT domain-containing protein [Methylomonas montana]